MTEVEATILRGAAGILSELAHKRPKGEELGLRCGCTALLIEDCRKALDREERRAERRKGGDTAATS